MIKIPFTKMVYMSNAERLYRMMMYSEIYEYKAIIEALQHLDFEAFETEKDGKFQDYLKAMAKKEAYREMLQIKEKVKCDLENRVHLTFNIPQSDEDFQRTLFS